MFFSHFHYKRETIDTFLPYQVKTQYLQTKNIVDTSIKHQISGQATTVVKGCRPMDMFNVIDTAFSLMEEH